MACVLVFNVSDPGKINELDVLALRLGFTVRTVSPDRQKCIIDDLLAGKYTVSGGTPSFRDEMLVMDGFSHEELNFLLNELIRTGNRIALKAVVTPTNRTWSAAVLHAQLVAEDSLMKRSGGAK